MNILVTLPLNETQKSWLSQKAPEASFHYIPVKQLTADMLADTEVVIGNAAPALLREAPQLRWVQLNSAGADAYCKPGALPPGTLLTNATGAYGLALSEHMLAMLLAMMKKLYLYHDNQKQGLWRDEGPVTSIYGAKVLVIGMGDIGGQFARRAKALGAYVIGMRRRSVVVPEYADEMGTMEELDRYLARADIVVTSLPGTRATYKLFNAGRFAAMRQGAYFVNIGRGTAVVQEALCAAVANGHIAGAAVDVTDPEPLPPENPMWHTPGIYITPHISGQYHLAATLDNIVHIAADNLEAFLQGKTLRNEVDPSTGYKK